MNFKITNYPLIAARVYWINLLVALVYPPVIEINCIITILTIRDLFLKMSEHERIAVKKYLFASFIMHLFWAISLILTFLFIDHIAESIIIAMLILNVVGFGLILLFLYYFQTRLNTLENYRGVDIWDLIFTPWFLQRWNKVLISESTH
jgi:hypothetical protein